MELQAAYRQTEDKAMSFVTRGLLTVLLCLLLVGCAGSADQKSAGQYLDDTVITVKVKGRLIKASDVDAVAINVETFKGVVQLSGFVDSEQTRSRAAVIASGVVGVKRVINDLVVSSY